MRLQSQLVLKAMTRLMIVKKSRSDLVMTEQQALREIRKMIRDHDYAVTVRSRGRSLSAA